MSGIVYTKFADLGLHKPRVESGPLYFMNHYAQTTPLKELALPHGDSSPTPPPTPLSAPVIHTPSSEVAKKVDLIYQDGEPEALQYPFKIPVVVVVDSDSDSDDTGSSDASDTDSDSPASEDQIVSTSLHARRQASYRPLSRAHTVGLPTMQRGPGACLTPPPNRRAHRGYPCLQVSKPFQGEN